MRGNLLKLCLSLHAACLQFLLVRQAWSQSASKGQKLSRARCVGTRSARSVDLAVRPEMRLVANLTISGNSACLLAAQVSLRGDPVHAELLVVKAREG